MSVFPAVVGFSVVAPEVILFAVGEKWQEAIAPVQLLTLRAGIAAVIVLTTQVLEARRAVKFNMYVSIARLCILPPIFFAVAPYGLNAVALAWLIATPIELFVRTVRMFQLTDFRLSEYLRAFLPATAGAAAMFAVLYATRMAGYFPLENMLLSIGSQVALGGVTYGLVLILFFRPRLKAYVSFARELRSRKKTPVLTATEPE